MSPSSFEFDSKIGVLGFMVVDVSIKLLVLWQLLLALSPFPSPVILASELGLVFFAAFFFQLNLLVLIQFVYPEILLLSFNHLVLIFFFYTCWSLVCVWKDLLYWGKPWPIWNMLEVWFLTNQDDQEKSFLYICVWVGVSAGIIQEHLRCIFVCQNSRTSKGIRG